MELLLVIGVVVLLLVLSFSHSVTTRRRQQVRMALATKLGLRFDPQKDRALADRYAFLNRLQTGSNRYAFNVCAGRYQGCDVTVFDYHYERHALESKRRTPEHHYLSCLLLRLPRPFPELTIAREGLLSKVVQAVGGDDIDFESYEFSRRFRVRSPDKKFAYDICHARMIEYLLANDDLTIEIERQTLAITFGSRLVPERIEPNLNRLIALRGLMPEYLFPGR